MKFIATMHKVNAKNFNNCNWYISEKETKIFEEFIGKELAEHVNGSLLLSHGNVSARDFSIKTPIETVNFETKFSWGNSIFIEQNHIINTHASWFIICNKWGDDRKGEKTIVKVRAFPFIDIREKSVGNLFCNKQRENKKGFYYTTYQNKLGIWIGDLLFKYPDIHLNWERFTNKPEIKNTIFEKTFPLFKR